MAIARSRTGTSSAATTFTLLYGWQVRETAGSTARFTIRVLDTNGVTVVDVNLAANESAGLTFPHPIENPGEAVFYAKADSGAISWIVYGT